MRCSSLHLATAAVLLAACGRSADLLPPAPAAVDPSVAHTAAPVRVTIRGERFYLAGQRHLGSGTDLDASFHATLGGVALTDVRWIDDGSLEAVVPAGLAGDALDLAIDGPTGHGELRAAFRASPSAPATLRATAQPLPPTLVDGDRFTLAVDVTNDGDTDANSVSMLDPQALGSGAAAASGRAPSPQAIPSRQTRTFTWTYVATRSGDLAYSCSGTGADSFTGAPLPVSASWPRITVQSPASLLGVLSAPSGALPGETFDVRFTVTNGGSEPIGSLAAPSLVIDSSAAGIQSEPADPPTSLAGGASVTYSWSLLAGASGAATLIASVQGNPSAGVSLSTSVTSTVVVSDAAPLSVNPFDDDSAFANLFAYHGYLYAGPNQAGTGAVRMKPDGTDREPVSFALEGDTTADAAASASSVDANTASGPFPSFGATGCAMNTDACGPDNESARGYLGAVSFLGNEWMIGSGANPSSGSLFRFYATTDATAAPDFSYVDMSAVVKAGIKTMTTAAVLGSKLYLGFSGMSASRPSLVALSTAPVAPGLDATAADLLDLNAKGIPAISKTGTTSALDALVVFDTSNDPASPTNLLYAFDDGGCAHSINADPGPADWVACTPSAAAYTGKDPVTPTGTGDLLPAGKAFPAVTVWKGRLFAARNTTSGPQLWMCDPPPGAACESGNWTLIAPNVKLDSQLSQFDDAGNTKITLLAATSAHLYVGFDNQSPGVQLFSTTAATPVGQGDFNGSGGCIASRHASTPGCDGIGGAGLGASATRFFDGKPLTFPSGERLYVAAGDGATAARLFRFAQ